MEFKQIEEKLESSISDNGQDDFDNRWESIKEEVLSSEIKNRRFKKFMPLVSVACAIVIALSIIIPLTVNRKPSASGNANGAINSEIENEKGSDQSYYADKMGIVSVTEEEFYLVSDEKWKDLIDFRKFACESFVLFKPEGVDLYVGGIVGGYDDFENINYMFDVEFYDDSVYVHKGFNSGYSEDIFINGAKVRYTVFNDYGDSADYRIYAEKGNIVYIINCTTVGYDIDGFLNFFFG